MFLNFKQWIESHKALTGLGIGIGASALGWHMLPQKSSEEVESKIKIEETDDGRNFIVEFKGLSVPNETTGSRGRFLKRYYEKAKDIVLDWLLDNESISFKTSGQLIRTAGTANLELLNYEVNRHEPKIIFTIHQKTAQNLENDSAGKPLIRYKKTIK